MTKLQATRVMLALALAASLFGYAYLPPRADSQTYPAAPSSVSAEPTASAMPASVTSAAPQQPVAASIASSAPEHSRPKIAVVAAPGAVSAPNQTSVARQNTTAPITSTPETIQASLHIGSQTYQLNLPTGSSVYDALKQLQQSGQISMTIETSSLGVLVTSLNGQANGDGGRYWLLRLNGAFATRGAGSATVHNGDQIDWQLEPSS